MAQLRRLLACSTFICVLVFCESKTIKDLRNIFASLGYFDGYKSRLEKHYRMPAIIIVPFVNQQQTVSIYEIICDKNYIDKLVNEVDAIDTDMTVTTKAVVESDDIEVFPKPALKRDVQKEKDMEREADTRTESNIEDKETTSPISTTEKDNITETSEIPVTATIGISTIKPGSYPNPQYNNEVVNSIMLTTEAPKILADNDTSRFYTSETNNVKPNHDSFNNKYYSSFYNNVNENVLNSQSYNEDNDLPPLYDERWRKFSMLDPDIRHNGFRPLAGLYYDGFLHKPLKIYNFVTRSEN